LKQRILIPFAALSIVATLMTLVLLFAYEFYLNTFETSLHLPKNGFHVNSAGDKEHYTWDHLVKNNNMGFRDDFNVSKNKGDAFRILVLGDSLTWGAGLATSQRYTNLTQNILNAQSGQKKIEVINASFPGAPLVKYRDRLKQISSEIRPDLIVIGFCLNDPQPRSQSYSIESEKFYQKFGRIIDLFRRGLSYLGLTTISESVPGTLRNILTNLGVTPQWWVSLDRTYNQNSPEWINLRKALEDIYKINEELGNPDPIFLVLNQGTYIDKPTDYRTPNTDPILQLYLKWYHQAEKEAQTVGYDTGNIEEILATRYFTKPMSVNPYDGHPNADLNEFYAEKLTQIISNKIKKASE